jgi:hypothetical protein
MNGGRKRSPAAKKLFEADMLWFKRNPTRNNRIRALRDTEKEYFNPRNCTYEWGEELATTRAILTRQEAVS